MRYAYQKEAVGYSVWSLAAATGDRRDWIADVRNRRDAQRMVDRLTQ